MVVILFVSTCRCQNIFILSNLKLFTKKSIVLFDSTITMGKGNKRKRDNKETDDDSSATPKFERVIELKEESNEFNLRVKHTARTHITINEKRLIIVLDGAHLETVKVGKEFELLNCDDHTSLLRKFNREPSTCRPDITHQSLMMLNDSPLNRAGLLQVYIRTEKNVLIEINPQTRIPRTFRRFSGLMVQLLHKFSIKASDSGIKLMKVIKNPITDHLPVGCKKYGMSFGGKFLKNCRELVPAQDEPIVVVIGAFAHGSIKSDYTEELISISNFPLSAALTCTKICSAFEEVWGII